MSACRCRPTDLEWMTTLTLVVNVAVADVGFDVEVGLALGVEAVFHPDVFGIVTKKGRGFFALFDVGFIVDVRGAGMDFDGVGSHGGRRVHVFGQKLKVELHLFRQPRGHGIRCRAHTMGQRVAVLEHLGVV